MQISNLEYLQVANLEEVKGGYDIKTYDYDKKVEIDKEFDFEFDIDIKKKYFDVDVDQHGTAALDSDITQVVEIHLK